MNNVVRYEQQDGVGVITIDRPPLNVYDDFLHWELEQAWVVAARDDAARVIVLRSMGTHFCAGADTKGEYRKRPADAGHGFSLAEELDFIRNLPKPTIAAVQGGCIGGGQRFVFPCDLIFCTQDAFFRDPLVRYGGIGGIQSPVHTWMYGPRLAKEMLYGGDRLPATRLYAMGTVNRLYDSVDELHAAAIEFAAGLVPLNQAALRQAKRSVDITMDIIGQHYIRSRFAELTDEFPVMNVGPNG